MNYSCFSDKMLSWIKSCKQLLPKCYNSNTSVTVVLGNMACDLDSGVSSIVLAFHRSVTSKERVILPVLNIVKEDYPLKTELVAALESEGVNESVLVFRDDINFEKIVDLKLIIVDHNVPADDDKDLYDNRVVEIIDHHVKETDCSNAVIEMVGSCSSLVLSQILKENPHFKDDACLRLVHGTILIDTVLLNPEAKKVTKLDIEMVEKCENVLDALDRNYVFNKLNSAKKKVDHLDAKQLLRRDFKTLYSKTGSKICLSSIPMLAKIWSKLPNVRDHVEKFNEEGRISLLLVLGSNFEDDKKERDLIIIGNGQLFTSMTVALETCTEPNLELMKQELGNNFHCYKQLNIAASRKQIMPIVKAALGN